MKILKEAVENYLATEESNYALLMKGKWGSGKTFFFKEAIVPIIEKVGLKPLYISLYGINKTTDISRGIFCELHPFVNSKAGKKVTELGKAIFGGISAYGLSIKLNTEGIEPETWLSIDKSYVLCFDDLERAKLDVDEVLGFINNFVEHDNIKTILIANEDEIISRQLNEDYIARASYITKQQCTNAQPSREMTQEEIFEKVRACFLDKISYPRIKEKMIGITIDYTPDLQEILPNIIHIYHKDNDFKEFLEKHKEIILELFKRSEGTNIRALKHALDNFRTIYLHLKSVHNKVANDFSIKLLFAVLSLTFETKANFANVKKEFESITNTEELIMKLHFPDEEGEKKSYLEAFHSKYYSDYNDEFHFSKAAFNYILKGYLQKADFDAEILMCSKEIENPKTTTIRSILSSYYELDDTEFTETVNTVLLYIKNGEVNLPLYPKLFSYFSFYLKDGLIETDMATLKDNFKAGLLHIRQNLHLDELMSYGGAFPDDNHETDEYKEIQSLTEQYINELNNEYLTTKCSKLFEQLPDNYDNFKGKLTEEDRRNYSDMPIFKYCSPDELFSKIIILKNTEIIDFLKLLNNRYSLNPFLKEDYDTLKQLKEKLDTYNEREGKLSAHLLKRLSYNLGKICSKLNTA